MTCADHEPHNDRISYGGYIELSNTRFRSGERQKQCSECERWIWPSDMRPRTTSALNVTKEGT